LRRAAIERFFTTDTERLQLRGEYKAGKFLQKIKKGFLQNIQG